MRRRSAFRLTRGSYKRKLIMYGVSVFTSLALTATGFAAWVLSNDAEVGTSGEVEIGAVTEASIEIKDLVFVDKDTEGNDVKNFIFEPLEDDTTGRVRYDGESTPENLDLKIAWTVVNYQNLDDLFVEFKIPASVKAAIDKNYIALPTGFEIQPNAETINEGNVNKTYYVAKYSIGKGITASGETADKLLSYQLSESNGIKTVTFTLKLEFYWGSAFEGTNPGIYYDTVYEDDSDKGAGVPYDTVKATLNEFKATLHGITYNSEFEALTEDQKATQYSNNPIDKYYVVVKATVA